MNAIIAEYFDLLWDVIKCLFASAFFLILLLLPWLLIFFFISLFIRYKKKKKRAHRQSVQPNQKQIQPPPLISKEPWIDEYVATDYYKATNNPWQKVVEDEGMYGEFSLYYKIKDIRNDGGKFVFNCFLPRDENETTEVDMILIHKTGIYVFENKNYNGWIYGSENDNTWTETFGYNKKNENGEKTFETQKFQFQNPIRQNRLHIRCMKNLIPPNIPIYSIITFSDNCTLKSVPDSIPGVSIVYLNDTLSEILRIQKESPIMLTDKCMTDLYNILQPYTQITEEIKKNHIEKIQQKKEIKEVIF